MRLGLTAEGVRARVGPLLLDVSLLLARTLEELEGTITRTIAARNRALSPRTLAATAIMTPWISER